MSLQMTRANSVIQKNDSPDICKFLAGVSLPHITMALIMNQQMFKTHELKYY